MSPFKRPLWKCPLCGRKFANRNQWHSCTTRTVEDCLEDKSEQVVRLFLAYQDVVRACGPVRVHAQKTRIAFITRMTFASAMLKRDWVEVGMILPYRSPSRRFHRFFPAGTGGAHYLRLDKVEQLDDEVRQWLRDAYEVGQQRTPKAADRAAQAPAAAKRPRSARNKAAAKAPPRAGSLFYLHWNEREAEERAAALRALGHKVRVHWSTETTPKWGDYLPDAYVISLERLPSHGRGYAAWIGAAKKRSGIPIVFVGGRPDKVGLARHQFPSAAFCAPDELADTLNRVLAK